MPAVLCCAVLCREALQQFSARQLRLMFLMAPWNKTVSYGETMRAEMRAREQAIKNFFQNVDVALREGDAKQATTAAKWGVSACYEMQQFLSLCVL
jgi:cysteinyl-tRNA synthetase